LFFITHSLIRRRGGRIWLAFLSISPRKFPFSALFLARVDEKMCEEKEIQARWLDHVALPEPERQ
jgi:hypothetical protein